MEVCLEEYEKRQRVLHREGQYKTSTHHADVPSETYVMFKKIFHEPLFSSPSLIPYSHEFNRKELERRALVKRMVKEMKIE